MIKQDIDERFAKIEAQQKRERMLKKLATEYLMHGWNVHLQYIFESPDGALVHSSAPDLTDVLKRIQDQEEQEAA